MMVMKNVKFGFTLVELLIVIALLGALAVGLLAALDPFEQLKKGTDTGVRNTVSEIQGAFIRYYALKNQMPWCADDECITYKDAGVVTTEKVAAVKVSELVETIQAVVDTGELKTDFVTLAGGALTKITIFGENADPTIQVCYKPNAKAFVADPNTKFVAVDGLEAAAGTCKGQGGTDVTCLWCVK